MQLLMGKQQRKCTINISTQSSLNHFCVGSPVTHSHVNFQQMEVQVLA